MGPKILALLNKTVTTFKVGNLDIDATYWQVAVLLLLLFMLVFTLARIRYLYVHWSAGKSALAFGFWGFLLAIGLEGLFIFFGRTIFTDILGVEKIPKPFSTVLNIGRSEYVKVLGSQNNDTDSVPEIPADQMYFLYSGMSQEEEDKFTKLICEP